MNDRFVSIKVDREERPDVDGLYMTAVVAQTGQGGWPMTVFLLPDGRPFYGGTYFPPEARGGLPSFRQVLDGIASAYRERRDVVEQQAAEMAASLQQGRLGAPDAGFRSTEGTLLDALLTLRGQHDERNGGFGRAPKFPPHSVLTFLLRMHRRTGSEEALRDGAAHARAAWPTAASTTSSAAASTATPSTRSGSCRTSSRCSTTTRCSRARTSRPGR